MRILHLAYEDPRAPGSGGGAVRTREIDRRLARRHDVVSVVAPYAGARSRREDGVRWMPIGPRIGRAIGRLPYFALAPLTPLRWRPDLVVDDLSAPFGATCAPLFFRPVVASVQWLFARQMRDKYHLPFDLVERAGLRSYDDLIAVSEELARELRRRRPDALVETIPNGVDASLFEVAPSHPRHLLFLGRLDIRQKGLDLLLEIMADIEGRLGPLTPPMIVAGDGADQRRFAQAIAEHRLGHVVTLVGRVAGDRKSDLIAQAHAVLMPSRFETFGMVAVEAQAGGVPLVAFDVVPLREVTGGEGVVLVEPFNTRLFAQAAVRLVSDAAHRCQLGTRGRRWARRYDWDEIAGRQEAHYERAVERHRQAVKR